MKTDHEIDIEFGQWLREQRASCDLTLEQVATRSGIPAERLKSLELGYADRGITQKESEKLRVVYRVSFEELIDRASGKKSDAPFHR